MGPVRYHGCFDNEKGLIDLDLTEKIRIFTDFYNSAVTINRSHEDGKPFDLIGSIDKKSISQIRVLFDRHVSHVFGKQESENLELDNEQWWGSMAFFGFVGDIDTCREIVASYLDDRSIQYQHLTFLNTLGSTLKLGETVAIRKTDEKQFIPNIREPDYDSETIDLTQYRLTDWLGVGGEWHDLEIGRIGVAFHGALIAILTEEAEMRRCVADWCRKIFKVSAKGRGKSRVFCGGSCRTRSYLADK